MERVMVFIDSGNWYKGATKELEIKKPDIEKFIRNITSGKSLIRSYYYTAIVPMEQSQEQHKRQQSWLSRARHYPRFEVRFGKLKPYPPGSPKPIWKEKGVDVFLGVDLVQGAYRSTYDIAYLITGDTDLIPAIQAAKDAGKIIEVFSYNMQYDLQQAADKFHHITREMFQ